jgi:hypothetical protein
MTDEARTSPVSAQEGDVLYRLRDLSPGYGNIIREAVEEIERLRTELAALRPGVAHSPGLPVGVSLSISSPVRPSDEPPSKD